MLIFDRYHGLYFDKDGAGGSGGDGDGDTPEPKTPPVVPDEKVDDKTPPTGEDKPGDVKLSSQQLKSRLERASATERKAMFAELGVASLDELQEKLNAGEKAITASLSATEKLQKDLDTANTEKEKADARVIEAEKSEQRSRLEVQAVGKMAGVFHDPQAVLKLLDLSEVDLDSSGFSGLDDAIEAAKTEFPWALVGEGDPAPKGKKKKKDPSLDPANPAGDKTPTGKTDTERKAQFFGGGGKEGFFEAKDDGVKSVEDTTKIES